MGSAGGNSGLDYILNNLEMMKEQCEQEQKRLSHEIVAHENLIGYPARLANSHVRQIEINNGAEVLALPDLPKNPQPHHQQMANKQSSKQKQN